MRILTAIKNMRGYASTMRCIAVVVLVDGSSFLMGIYEWIVAIIGGLF